MKKFLPLLICVLFCLIGCKSGDPKINGQWNTYSLEKDGVAQQIALSYINFQTRGVYAKVYGDAGVNTFSGAAEVNKNNFLADDFAVTKMMGDPVAMEFEDLFLETLSKATEYYIQDDILTINAPDARLKLQFVRAK